MNDKFAEENRDFVFKVTLETNNEDDRQTRRVKLPRIVDSAGKVSYEELVGLVIRFSFPAVNNASFSNKKKFYKAKLTYHDVDTDLIYLGSTEELIDAIEQYSDRRFVRISAKVERQRSTQRQQQQRKDQKRLPGVENNQVYDVAAIASPPQTQTHVNSGIEWNQTDQIQKLAYSLFKVYLGPTRIHRNTLSGALVDTKDDTPRSLLNSDRRWYRGQMIDCRDTTNMWYEATILETLKPDDILPPKNDSASGSETTNEITEPAADPIVSFNDFGKLRYLFLEPCAEDDGGNEGGELAGFKRRKHNDEVQLLLVRYKGWSYDWDEWIRSDSERIRPFRTRTQRQIIQKRASLTPIALSSEAPPTFTRQEKEVDTKISERETLHAVTSDAHEGTSVAGNNAKQDTACDEINQMPPSDRVKDFDSSNSIDSIVNSRNMEEYSIRKNSLCDKNTKSTMEEDKDNNKYIKQQEKPDFIHMRHTCDLCLETPIIGNRYHATNIPDYDLCERCYSSYEGDEIQFEVAMLDQDRHLQQRWQELLQRKKAKQYNLEDYNADSKEKKLVDAVLTRKGEDKEDSSKVEIQHQRKEVAARAINKQSEDRDLRTKEKKDTEDTTPMKGEIDVSPEKKPANRQEENSMESNLQKSYIEEKCKEKDESFSSDADGNGSVAGFLGETLDKFANGIDEMVEEIQRIDSEDYKNEISEPHEGRYFKGVDEEESLTDDRQENDKMQNAKNDKFGIKHIASEQSVAIPKLVSKDDGQIDEVSKEDGTINSWQVVEERKIDVVQNEDTEAIALASQLIGSSLFNSGMNSQNSRDEENVLAMSGCSISTIATSEIYLEHASIHQRWTSQLEQLKELGFDEKRCVEALEKLEAANIGVEAPSERITVAQVVNELLR